MIVTVRNQFEAVCRQRGYTIADAMPCVVSQDGDRWTIDERHPAYPRRRPRQSGGPGTELKRLLTRFGIIASETCSCAARARQMDRNERSEPGWCERNVETIVGWLREEAGRRGLPFLDAVGKVLVRRAISAARKEQQRAEKTTEGDSKSGSAV